MANVMTDRHGDDPTSRAAACAIRGSKRTRADGEGKRDRLP